MTVVIYTLTPLGLPTKVTSRYAARCVSHQTSSEDSEVPLTASGGFFLTVGGNGRRERRERNKEKEGSKERVVNLSHDSEFTIH